MHLQLLMRSVPRRRDSNCEYSFRGGGREGRVEGGRVGEGGMEERREEGIKGGREGGREEGRYRERKGRKMGGRKMGGSANPCSLP